MRTLRNKMNLCYSAQLFVQMSNEWLFFESFITAFLTSLLSEKSLKESDIHITFHLHWMSIKLVKSLKCAVIFNKFRTNGNYSIPSWFLSKIHIIWRTINNLEALGSKFYPISGLFESIHWFCHRVNFTKNISYVKRKVRSLGLFVEWDEFTTSC